MTDRIPAQIVETIDPAKPIRLTPAKAGGPIHTRAFTGLYRRIRLIGTGLLFALFFGTAWINHNGRQAVLWDLPERQFHVFGATFWPQDFILLSAILIIAAFGLFFITVLAGRVWCGYTCPQSVWTWIFMRIENLTEGDRGQRIKLDAAPWTLNKLLRRSAKHALWLLVSLVTALAFVGYFTPVRQLTLDLVTWQVGGTAAVWLGLFTAATYFNAAFMREKICRDLCPYSRFQSVMFDRDTLLISYDAARGENRGPRRKGVDPRSADLGDCVDCTLCVQVCPTGIDIRDGLQLECISCGACIDACDSVMDKMGYERGLVRYSSERAMSGGRTRWLRPALVVYGGAMLLMIGALVWAIAARPMLTLDVARDRSMFRENAQGEIENTYRVKLLNKSQQARTYQLQLEAEPGYRLEAPAQLQLAGGDVAELAVVVVRSRDARTASTLEVGFTAFDLSEPDSHAQTASTFLAPVR